LPTRPAADSSKPTESTAALTRLLSSKHLTVTTGPKNFRTPPKSLKTGGKTRKSPLVSLLCASHWSQVANCFCMLKHSVFDNAAIFHWKKQHPRVKKANFLLETGFFSSSIRITSEGADLRW
jgi:hypothetical protein